jgi:uncharacterized BrkB/YihY/UPF0761 family membrane protein
VSSVRAVPETELMSGDTLSADDAWHTVRRFGLGHLLSTGFVRFRYGDGFSHARAFALQLALATVPLIIAGAGLAAALGVESFAEVVARTVVALSPGSSDALLRDVVDGGTDEGSERGEVVVVLGLATAFLAATSAFAQLERGRHAPRRRQPGLSWLAVGATVTVLAWLAGSGLLGLYVVAAGNFGETYGPLTAVMALLLWANVTGVALLAGVALAAQLEAVRAGDADPLLRDSDDDGIPDHLDEQPGSPRR